MSLVVAIPLESGLGARLAKLGIHVADWRRLPGTDVESRYFIDQNQANLPSDSAIANLAALSVRAIQFASGDMAGGINKTNRDKMSRTFLAAALALAVSFGVGTGTAAALGDEKLNAALSAYDAEQFETALPDLKAASEGGSVEARYRLGMMYRFGWGVEKDFGIAREHFQIAADKGHAEAQSELAKIFKDGRGIERDYVTAARWFEKAAMQHQGVSQLNLARFYRSGKGVDKSAPHAWAWFSLAVDNQYMDAIGHRARLQRKMSEDEIAKAKMILADLKKQMPPRQ